MKFALAATFLSLGSLVASSNVAARLSCSQADRFGDPTLSPTTVKAGDTITVNVDLTCGVQNFGLIPQFLDYSIEVLPPNNNGFEAPLILGRHAIKAGALSDTLVAKIPHAFFVSGAPYSLVVTNIHNINGTDGSPVLTSGGVILPITITS
ncbi:hypothetical protein D9613_011218 [Agrocybe pediades]|uniref:Spore coat protein U domain-containing protein n=1 Tax=Agrocybe pediades TaxID=84607 RepID=A0A8H4VNE2_9AGAR|nr:hypothetical protein D9613_011218 [Agrocybe pediades]